MNVAAAEFKPTYTTLGLNVMKPNTPRAKAPEFIPARIFIPARRMVDSKHSAVEVRSGAKDTSVTHSSLLQGHVTKLSISERVAKKSTPLDVQGGRKAKPGKGMKGANERALSLPVSNKQKESKFKGGSRQRRLDHEKENGHNKGADSREKTTKLKNSMEHNSVVEKKEKKPSQISKGKGAIKKNTESFEPNYNAPDIRVVIALPTPRFNRAYSVHDVVCVPQLACAQDDLSLYDTLVNEIKSVGRTDLFVSWHGDTHLIADDKKMGGRWKDMCPSFLKIVERLRTYFQMDIKATRLNWYADSGQWKPFHFDAAGVKPKFAQSQNCTLAISLGAERECAFEHAKSGTTVSIPQPHGCCYALGRDVNLEFRHGVLPQKHFEKKGRISIIAWGWVDQSDEGSRQKDNKVLKQPTSGDHCAGSSRRMKSSKGSRRRSNK